MQKQELAATAVLGGLIIFAVKLYSYYVSGSVALLSDALESIVNILASLMMLVSVSISMRPPDEDHRYGHQKVENFVAYVEQGFYDGLVFHRVMGGFMVQGGGFKPDGTWKSPTRDPLESEASNGLKNLRGTLAMARSSDPDSATSQFYINTVDNSNLDYPKPDGYGYTVFGKVVKGIDVVDDIEASPTGSKLTPYGAMDNWPIENIVIVRAYIKET